MVATIASPTPVLPLVGSIMVAPGFNAPHQEVCLLLKVSPRTLQTLRDNGTLAYTQICHKTYYKPGDVESIIRIVEERRKRAESMGKSI